MFGMGSLLGYGGVTFDRASLAATLYLINYTGGTWTSSASAGTSGGRTLPNGVPPDVGANFGIHPSANFNGSTHQLYDNARASSDYITAAAYSFHIIAEFDAFGAPADVSVEPALISDVTASYYQVTVTTSGIRASHYFNARTATTPIPVSTGVKYCVQVKYDGTDLKCRVNGKNAAGVTGWESVANGNVGNLAAPLRIGANYGGGALIDGREALVMVFQTALSDATMDLLLTDARTNFGVL